MTQEDKELLIKDLCARLPYKVNVCLYEKETCILMGVDGYEVYLDVDSDSFRIESIKPYLRPLSSMTEEEHAEFYKVGGLMSHKVETDTYVLTAFSPEAYDWLNAHHFDYRGLIEKGLALEASEGMYNFK